LLGRDPLSIELIWRQLYEVSAHIVGKGAELRGLSAIDVPLWDIFGQATNMPIWQLLGGAARDRIKTYNTSGGPHYGRATLGRSGYIASVDQMGRYEDLIGFMTDAARWPKTYSARGLAG
jgi:L-alanine-DL-glutamate epimerase-like enolase superfamily enzyme